jgi:hypothetical protein
VEYFVFFVNFLNHRYLKYLILLISRSCPMDEKIAECGAKGAWAIRNDIPKALATINIGGIHCLFVNSENHRYLPH